jgi:ribosomal protein S18 acetylase RimI-like enzyme
MIGCFHEQDGHVGEIRRLRVDKKWQHTNIGARLLEHALEHCKVHKFLKVVMDTRFDTEAVIGLFDRFGFQHTRSKNIHGKELLEFYLDLYRQMKDE